MGKDKKEQKRLQEERMNEILSRLDSIENAVNENKQSVEENSEKIETNTEIATAVPVSKEEAQKEAVEVEKKDNEVKKLSLDEEFDLLLNKLLTTTITESNISRLGHLNMFEINKLKTIAGGVQFGIHFLRAEDNMMKILENQTFGSNIGNIRSLPAVHGLIKTLDETSGLLRKRIGLGHRLAKNAVEGAKGWGNSVMNVGRALTGNEKVDMIGKTAMQLNVNNKEKLDRNEKAQQHQGSSMPGGRKTQRRKKHKKSGKHHKTRKHH